MRCFADEKVLLELNSQLFKSLNFADKMNRVHNHSVANHALFLWAKDSRGEQVKDVFFAADENGVASVVASLHADYDVGPVNENVNNFPFAFVAPLGAD